MTSWFQSTVLPIFASVTPLLTVSKFKEGMLTAEEFVKAGDHLVDSFPSWHWSSGDPSKQLSYLPPDKQFLFTSGMPCRRRVADIASATLTTVSIAGELGEAEDWEVPVFGGAGASAGAAVESDASEEKATASTSAAEGSIPSAASAAEAASTAAGEDDGCGLDDSAVAVEGSSPISALRKYDVSITYDNYYRTPRIWLFGYDDNGTPLAPEAIYQDVMQDYAKKTVTVEAHPHLQSMQASIHPCRHAEAMKRILDEIASFGSEPQVEQYMFIFLKFIQGVVPTIEYDFTADVQLHE